MKDHELTGLNATDPLGFLAALGVLRVVARRWPAATLRWVQKAEWCAAIQLPDGEDLVDILWTDVERWRAGHAAIDFAREADRKIQDLKHQPEEFREFMSRVVDDSEAEPFVAAYGTGVAVDGSGQTKPTSLHFTAGQQRFMDSVLTALDEVTRSDLEQALVGPWKPRSGKNLRWRAASERTRALLSYDPGKESSTTVVGAVWLAFQGMPFLTVAARGRRVVTTGFMGRGRSEVFTWPVWTPGLVADEVRVALSLTDLGEMPHDERSARGIAQVFRAKVVRSSQGYGNFSAASPV